MCDKNNGSDCHSTYGMHLSYCLVGVRVEERQGPMGGGQRVDHPMLIISGDPISLHLGLPGARNHYSVPVQPVRGRTFILRLRTM